MQLFELNNIKINAFKIDELEKCLCDILASENSPKLITTFNLDFLRITEINREFLEICKYSLWNLADGIGITSLIWLKYRQKVKRITGNDIFPILLRIANSNHYRLAIIGGSKEVSDKVCVKIKNEYPDIDDNLLCISPEMYFEEDESYNQNIVDKIISFKPDIVLAAFGCPRQEIWLSAYMAKFNSKINIGIGSVLDYYSGIKKRSPIFIRKIGLEWLWRLVNEPIRLFKRYVVCDIPFFIRLLYKISKEKLRIKK